MKEQLIDLANRLRKAVASDTPRMTMQNVAGELDALATSVKDDDGSKSFARELYDNIKNHQYGLRGFGDGSLSRGRDLSSREKEVITLALAAYGKQS